MKILIALCAMTGVAAADAHAEKKKAPDKAPAKLEGPKAPAELAAMAKDMAGTWKCKGDGFAPDGSKSPVTSTSTGKLDLDKFWFVESLEVKGGMPMKMTSYTTYDAAAKKWRRVAVDNWGGYMHGTSEGLKDKKMSWTLDTVGSMGTGQFRDHWDGTNAKEPKVWGEMSMDKGKTWIKAYEMTCKK